MILYTSVVNGDNWIFVSNSSHPSVLEWCIHTLSPETLQFLPFRRTGCFLTPQTLGWLCDLLQSVRYGRKWQCEISRPRPKRASHVSTCSLWSSDHGPGSWCPFSLGPQGTHDVQNWILSKEPGPGGTLLYTGWTSTRRPLNVGINAHCC